MYPKHNIMKQDSINISSNIKNLFKKLYILLIPLSLRKSYFQRNAPICFPQLFTMGLRTLFYYKCLNIKLNKFQKGQNLYAIRLHGFRVAGPEES